MYPLGDFKLSQSPSAVPSNRGIVMFSMLPNEIIFQLTSYLGDEDYIAFANINSHMLSLLASNKKTLRLPKCYNLSIPAIEQFLAASSISGCNIHKLDLSNCYWLHSELLTNAILELSYSLKSLSVLGTKISSYQLSKILRKCHLISELSFSLSRLDSTFWIEGESQKEDEENEVILNCSTFFDIQESLGKLTFVHCAMQDDCLVMLHIFLCFCTNLESLHLEIGPNCKMPFDRSLLEYQQIRTLRRLLPSCSRFHELTCKIAHENEIMDLLAQLINNILSRKTCQLDTLWAPNISIGQYLQCLKPTLKSLQTSSSNNSMSDFKQVSCLRISTQQYLRQFASDFPSLEIASFRYDRECFLEFCSQHREIKVLQVQHCFPKHFCEPGLELAQGLAYLTNLTKFSINHNFFLEKDERLGIRSPIQQLVNCNLLNEVEIGLSTSSALERDLKTSTYSAKSSCLTSFCHCKHLTKLTLAYLKVDALDFISMILSTCLNLKSLRLTKIISDHLMVFDVVTQLKKGIPKAKSLEDFRWELGNDGFFTKTNLSIKQPVHNLLIGPEVFRALQLSSSLRRIVIIGDQSVKFDLMSTTFKWRSLVLACVISPNLTDIFHINSSHPAFQCYIGESTVEATDKVSASHANEMIVFESQIAKLPLCSFKR